MNYIQDYLIPAVTLYTRHPPYKDRGLVMRRPSDRRKKSGNAELPQEDIHPGARDRRQCQDQRLENLDVVQRQLLLAEMPGGIVKRKKRRN